jgi:hypothetical protein
MSRRKQPTIPDKLLDQLLGGADPRAALADGGLLDGLKKALAERVSNAELDHHLDDVEPDGRPNGRNGYGKKTVLTGTGRLELQMPLGHGLPPRHSSPSFSTTASPPPDHRGPTRNS